MAPINLKGNLSMQKITTGVTSNLKVLLKHFQIFL